jgi:hypothetical protein
MTLTTQDSPQRRAVARYLLRADSLFRRAARTPQLGSSGTLTSFGALHEDGGWRKGDD